MSNLDNYELNGIWDAIEKHLGLRPKDVAIFEDCDGRISVDCSELSTIPISALEELSDGHTYTEGLNKVYVEAKKVEDDNQLIVITEDVN